jgi:hypothetical protein
MSPPPGPGSYQPSRHAARSNTGPMVAGTLAVAAIAVLLIGAMMLIGQGLGTFSESSTLGTLAVGDCFNGARPDAPEGAVALIGDVEEVACGMPHDSELVAAFSYPSSGGASFPGERIVASYAEAECYVHFERYVGVPFSRSRLELTYVSPLEFNWRMGDRSIQCVVHGPTEQGLTGTVRNTRR